MIIITQMLENQIALLKKCLEFYANENNYVVNKDKSQIDLDKGFVARETLKSSNLIEEQHQLINSQYSEYLNTVEQEHKSPQDMIKEIRNIVDNSKKL